MQPGRQGRGTIYRGSAHLQQVYSHINRGINRGIKCGINLKGVNQEFKGYGMMCYPFCKHVLDLIASVGQRMTNV